MQVYEEIRQLEPKPAKMKSSLSWTAEKVEETFARTGVGRKTIAQIIENHESTPRKYIDHYFDR